MSEPFQNADYIRQLPDIGAKLYEALADIASKQGVLAQQVNGNISGPPAAPPPVNGLQVKAQNGHFSVAIQDGNEIYRGIQYHVEYADNPQFTNPQPWHLGPNRNDTRFLGNGTFYFRAFSSYGISASNGKQAAYYGPQISPNPVTGGGMIGIPRFLASQGTGTGDPGQGLSGPGPIPFRSKTGIPPIR